MSEAFMIAITDEMVERLARAEYEWDNPGHGDYWEIERNNPGGQMRLRRARIGLEAALSPGTEKQ